MASSAPRLSPRLLAALERADDGRCAIADVWRAVGVTADRLGLSRPSYERIRTLVNDQRRRRSREIRTSELLVDVALRSRPPDVLLDHAAGIPVPKRRPNQPK